MGRAAKAQLRPVESLEGLHKCPTGIRGLDEITSGGLPRGRPTLVCGGTGCGKTVLAMEFLARGALQYGEPGVFIAFEETAQELTKNFVSLGFDIDDLVAKKRLAVDYVHVERSEIEETGEYDLEGLFIRIGTAIDSVGAKRVAIDTIEALFSGFANENILRAELRRLFRWLKDRGVTTVITGERGKGTLTRHGLEEYVADCVILLDSRIADQICTRRMRVIKYRGSAHGADEYPFLIDEEGMSILPITSLALDYEVTAERISTGIQRVDAMLGGKGFYRGSSILVSGSSGSGKTSMAATFVDAACRRGERCLYFAFEESPSQVMRNMASIGIDLDRWVKKGLLKFHATRPTAYGLEMHLVTMHKLLDEFTPSVVVVDPISNLTVVGSDEEAKSVMTRLIDQMKASETTVMFTDLTYGGGSAEQTETRVSSLMDTWILVRNLESDGERNCALYVLKSRGMAHSNQVRELVLSDQGMKLVDVYTGPEGVLVGSARIARELAQEAKEAAQRDAAERTERDLERKRKLMEAQVAALRSEFESQAEQLRADAEERARRHEIAAEDRATMGRVREADTSPSGKPKQRRLKKGA